MVGSANTCRPIVGIDAFDLRQSEIDVTPLLPTLLDGTSHTFEIRVASLNDDGHGHATISEIPGSYWLVSGTIFLFLDKNGTQTTGTQPTISAPAPSFSISSSVTQNATGANQTLTYSTLAQRQISISSTITTSAGTFPVSWTQSLSYDNYNQLTNQGLVQFTSQNTTATDTGTYGYYHTYSYPLVVNSSYAQTSTSLGINGTISRGEDLLTLGPSVFPQGVQNFNVSGAAVIPTGGGSLPPAQQPINLPSIPSYAGSQLSTAQQASAEYLSNGNSSYSFGTTAQQFSFSGVGIGGGVNTELYSRNVEASNNTIVYDQQQLAGQTFNIPTGSASSIGQVANPQGVSAKAVLGRGPGKNKAQLGGGPGN